jgi:hypothetical protein
MTRLGWTGLLTIGLITLSHAAEPAAPGLAVGERPKPYAFNVVSGPHRGELTCYICATGDKPAVVVFARTLSEPLGQLLTALDGKVINDPKSAGNGLRGWVTLLGDGQPKQEERLATWGQRLGVRNLPLGVFEDAVGPPAYKIDASHDVSVIVFAQKKVTASFFYRAEALTPTARTAILAALPTPQP